jgi:hypothetical protein
MSSGSQYALKTGEIRGPRRAFQIIATNRCAVALRLSEKFTAGRMRDASPRRGFVGSGFRESYSYGRQDGSC